MAKPIIAPSILSADFSKFGAEIKAIDDAGCDWIHVDIMDGHFVPNISFGPMIVKTLRPLTKTFLDVHLMIAPVDPYIPAFAEAGADLISVHVEAGAHLHRSLQLIKSLGKKAGVVINPATPVSAIEHVIDDVDLILLMSVNPGFGGQKFIAETLNKLRQAKALIGDRDIVLEVDGGVTQDNVFEIAQAGANALVAGTSVFGQNDAEKYRARIDKLRSEAQRAL